jgi:hypothetical protein
MRTGRDGRTKRKAVSTVLTVRPSWSDGRVAEHCLVTYPFVIKVRRELAEGVADPATGNGYESTGPRTRAPLQTV